MSGNFERPDPGPNAEVRVKPDSKVEAGSGVDGDIGPGAELSQTITEADEISEGQEAMDSGKGFLAEFTEKIKNAPKAIKVIGALAAIGAVSIAEPQVGLGIASIAISAGIMYGVAKFSEFNRDVMAPGYKGMVSDQIRGRDAAVARKAEEKATIDEVKRQKLLKRYGR